MANQKTVTNWLVANRKKMDLRVKDCSWIRAHFPGWSDLEVSISVGGRPFVGRGSDPDADTALSKAFCEAVERYVCSANGISSLGVAGHFDAEAAKRNARLEFIERAAIADHHLSGLRLSETAVPGHIERHFSAHGVSLKAYVLVAGELPTVLCLANGLQASWRFGGILGLGTDPDQRQALSKALIECLRNLEAFIAEPKESLTCLEFDELSEPSAFDRQALLRNPEYFELFLKKFGEGEATRRTIAGSWERLENPAAALLNCPLEFYRFRAVDEKRLDLEFVG
jgi:hypothetical protein